MYEWASETITPMLVDAVIIIYSVYSLLPLSVSGVAPRCLEHKVQTPLLNLLK